MWYLCLVCLTFACYLSMETWEIAVFSLSSASENVSFLLIDD